MRSFIQFNRGLLNLPFHLKLWMGLLVGANFVAPLFFLDRGEALLVLGVLALSLALMSALTGVFGFTRILGLGHIAWIPLLALLWARLAEIPPEDPFGSWIRVLIGLNAISLVLDAVDVARYAAGDRGETVQGLS